MTDRDTTTGQAGLIDLLTVSELELLEEVTDRPTGTIIADFVHDSWSAKTLRALVWVLKRRTDPKVELDDLGAVTMADLQASIEDARGKAPDRKDG